MKTLEEFSDSELSEVFAVEVARWKPSRQHFECQEAYEKCYGESWPAVKMFPQYATDANAVLRHIGQFRCHNWDGDPEERARLKQFGGWCVSLVNGAAAWGPTFPRTACIALILTERAATAPTA